MLILMIVKIIVNANTDMAADSADSQGDFDAVRELELTLLEETGPRYIVVCKSPSETPSSDPRVPHMS
jgi:hypothetical protein